MFIFQDEIHNKSHNHSVGHTTVDFLVKHVSFFLAYSIIKRPDDGLVN